MHVGSLFTVKVKATFSSLGSCGNLFIPFINGSMASVAGVDTILGCCGCGRPLVWEAVIVDF